MSKPGVAGGDGAAVAPDPERPGAPCYPSYGCSETTPGNFSFKEAKLSGPVICGENQSVNGSLVTAIDLPVKEGSHAEDTGVEQQRASGGNGLPDIAQESHADELEPTTSCSHAEYTGEEQQSAGGDNDLPDITQGSRTDDPEPTASGCGEEPLLATNSSCLNDSITGIEGMKHVASNDINDVSCSPKARKLTRSSCYHGVSKNKWTGRFEAHLWDGSFQNVGMKRKGKLVYLGGYDSEVTAGRAHDLAAIKYWGSSASTKLNFSVSEYWRDIEEMDGMSREEYVASLIRKSSCFSRGASIYRGVTRKKDGRWQARIGWIADRKDIYLGTYNTEEEAAQAYDIAAVKLKGINAVTNFDISNYSEDLECLE